MRRLKQGAALAVATVAALAGTFAAGSPAMAASSPIAACGGGSYHVIDQHDLGKATIYLMYNGTTNCVVTWKDRPDSTYVGAWVRIPEQNWHGDIGYYSTYAGPVKVSAAGQCIEWSGAYGWLGDADTKEYTSPPEHCG